MKKIFFISAIVIAHFSYGQNLKIIDGNTKEPLENIAVYNNSRATSTISDKSGLINLDLFASEDTINFQHPAYKLASCTKDSLKRTDYILALAKRTIFLNEFVISASREKENVANVPYMIDILKRRDLKLSTSQTSADILSETGNVMIQKTQGGGGSPILRGFEANKILLVVDGVRMNNAIYRGGHLQNSITIDNTILDRTEIVFGPVSVMYGSDALGGVIHYITKDPKLAYNKKSNFEINAYTQYSTVNKGKKGHVDFNIGSKKIASLTSITYSKFEDIIMGKNRSFSSEENYGLVNHYADRINNRDTMIVNPNPQLQKNTGYEQYDFLQKVLFKVSKSADLIANIQYSTSSNIDRFDALTDYKNGVLKFAEYYYGPQKRLFSSIKAVVKNENPLFSTFNTTFAYQKIEESRNSRYFNVDSSLHQIENLDILSLNLDFHKNFKNQDKLNYGIEANINTLSSAGFYRNILSNEETNAQTRYPDGSNSSKNAAVYLSYKKHLSPKLILTEGVRFSYVYLNSTFKDTSFVKLPFERIKISDGAITNSTSLVYHPSKDWQLNLIISTGFRSPNIDDYGKVRAKKGFISIPYDQITPEYAHNVEFGVTKTLWNAIKINGTIYHTWLKNAIVRNDFSINGSDSIMYDGDYYTVYVNSNANNAIIRGASFSLSRHFILAPEKYLNVKSTLNIIKGMYKDEFNDSKSLGHIPPLFGLTRIEYEGKKVSFEISVVYNGKKNIEDFSAYGEDNENQAQSNGYPAWYTINSKLAYKFSSHFLAFIAINNIMDEHYKTFASAVSAPGRNCIVTLSANL